MSTPEANSKVEFASVDWLSIARTYLEAHVPPLGDQLAGVVLTISEVFTDAPPHLVNDLDRKMSWHFLIEGPNVSVGPGVPPGVTPTTIVDYQAVLPIARTVFSDNPEVLEQVRKRRRARQSNDSPTTTALPAALNDVLLGLHDELARRTI